MKMRYVTDDEHIYMNIKSYRVCREHMSQDSLAARSAPANRKTVTFYDVALPQPGSFATPPMCTTNRDAPFSARPEFSISYTLPVTVVTCCLFLTLVMQGT